MNAEEARKLTQRCINCNMPLLRKKIDALIEKAAQKGENVAYMTEYIEYNMRTRLIYDLREDGYIAEYKSDQPASYILISW